MNILENYGLDIRRPKQLMIQCTCCRKLKHANEFPSQTAETKNVDISGGYHQTNCFDCKRYNSDLSNSLRTIVNNELVAIANPEHPNHSVYKKYQKSKGTTNSMYAQNLLYKEVYKALGRDSSHIVPRNSCDLPKSSIGCLEWLKYNGISTSDEDEGKSWEVPSGKRWRFDGVKRDWNQGCCQITRSNNLGKIVKVYEYNGDYDHANPKFYKATDTIRGSKTAQQVWDKDSRKRNYIENVLGAELVEIWESDWVDMKRNF